MVKNKMKKCFFSIAGLGVVGSGLVKLWRDQRENIRKTLGLDLVLYSVAEPDQNKVKLVNLKNVKVFKDWRKLLEDKNSQICVELIGGKNTAKDCILSSLEKGKDVVTANKALLAEEYFKIFSVAKKNKRKISFEASVAGGIPIIKILRESYLTSSVHTIYGILNGTTNFILTKMQEERLPFFEALKEAQKKGFAEKNPSLDIDGIDAAHKAVILANLAFKTVVPFDKVKISGLRGFNLLDFDYARELGYIVKLLAVVRKAGPEDLEVYVEPVLLSEDHPMASVKNEFNAVYTDSSVVGESLFYGKGAGSMPTANSVLSDIIDLASLSERAFQPLSNNLKKWNINRNIMNRYYIRFTTPDRPGVLGSIAGILGKCGVSILSCVQKPGHERYVSVVMMTHICSYKSLDKAISLICKNSHVVKNRPVVLTVR